MALSGSFSKYPVTASYGNFGLYCEWSGTQSVSGNYTDVTLNVYLRYWSLNVGARDDSTVSINGESETYTVAAINHYPNSDYYRLIKTYTVRVPHNSDGTKSCTLSASWRMSGTYSGISVGTITASTTVTLDTIARASTITSASNVTLGNACSVKWTPAATSFRYKLKFVLGSWNYTTGAIHPNSTSAYTYDDYTIPLDVANQLPSAETGSMTVYLYTYSDSGCTTQIGSTDSDSFTVTVPSSIKPSISSVAATLVNSNPVINGWGIAVAGYTNVKVTATASGYYSSTISSFTISGGYSTTQNGTSLDYTGAVITSSGSKTFTVVARDNRGRSSDSKSATAITFYAYSKPSVTSFTAERSSSNAKQVIIKADWSFASVNSKNAATGILYYKKSSNTGWTEYGAIAKNTNTTLTVEFEETSSYNFKIVVTDSLSSSAQEEAFISTIEVLMDWRAGGKGLGIGKIAESDNLEIALDTIFMGNVYIQNDDGTKTSLADYIKSLIT